MSAQGRRLVLVVGVGRSGTSLLAGILGQLGFHIPQPEVKADDTNPRGFGEPRWVVDFHTRHLRRRGVTVNDARPAAWAALAAAGADSRVRAELRSWMEQQLDVADELVVKDPRTVWFLPLWRRCADELGLPTSYVTMLRHPAEIVASARKSYGPGLTTAGRASAWLNIILETEHATRGAPRAFVQYEDLLADWVREIQRTGALVGSSVLERVNRDAFPQVDAFVDPGLHRNRIDWEDLEVPARVRELAADVWRRMQALAHDGGDTKAARPALDAARAAYVELYAEAEAIAQSSVMAARAAAPRPPVGRGSTEPAPRSLRVRIARRIPKRYRRGLRRAFGTLRARS
jgi:hypothetical protein